MSLCSARLEISQQAGVARKLGEAGGGGGCLACRRRSHCLIRQAQREGTGEHPSRMTTIPSSSHTSINLQVGNSIGLAWQSITLQPQAGDPFSRHSKATGEELRTRRHISHAASRRLLNRIHAKHPVADLPKAKCPTIPEIGAQPVE